MFACLADAGISTMSLFANAPSTLTLGLIGIGCLLVFKVLQRQPVANQSAILTYVEPVAAEVAETPELEHRLAA